MDNEERSFVRGMIFRRILMVALAVILVVKFIAIPGFFYYRVAQIAEKQAAEKQAAEKAEEQAIIKSFSDGTIIAELNRETRTLTFSGSGAVADVENWVSLNTRDAHLVDRIGFERGIKSVGDREFNDGYFPNLTSVIFRGDVNMIGEWSFAHNANLKEVKFMGGCSYIDLGAFHTCPALKQVSVPDECRCVGAFDHD